MTNFAKGVSRNKPGEAMTIRPKKVKGPDMGSYEMPKSASYVRVRTPSWTVSKSKAPLFTELAARNKKGVPGPGNNNIEKCLNVISRPYTRKRL